MPSDMNARFQIRSSVASRCGLLCLLAIVFGARPAAAQDLTILEEEAMQSAVQEAHNWIVKIDTIGGLEVGGEAAGVGPTSGVVVSEDGLIISSIFNFSRLPSSILVTLPDGERKAAKLVATDHSRKLVLLKVETETKLTVPIAAKRSEAQVGAWAIAVGRVYRPDRLNVSTGVISATQRIWSRAIQTDAKISPANYGGALLDIHGRVLGVLTPMSPRGNSATAGSEWYDSGIGFAVPLEDIYTQLKRLSEGDDLHPGILGVSFESQDMYAVPAKVGAVRAKSPAREAGIQPGDTIVELSGKPISRLAQMKHALGPSYAGDTVSIVVTRGEEAKRVSLKATLVDKLVPYQHPFLGVLPRRDNDAFVVRYVFPGSPADAAGIKAGDTIKAIDGKPCATIEEAHQGMAAFEPKQSTKVVLTRNDKEQTVEVVLQPLPEDVPDDLPESRKPFDKAYEGAKAEEGQFSVPIPEEASSCTAFVPAGYDPRIGYGLVVLLGRPGSQEAKDLFPAWEQLASDNQLILLAPKAADDRGWKPSDVDFVVKTIESIMQTHSIDPQRVVLFGKASGGSMSYLIAGKRRDLIRAIVAVNAPYPQRTPPLENEPLQRLSIFSLLDDSSKLKARIDATVKGLRNAKFPVTELPAAGGKLSNSDYESIVRWADALDRL